MHKKIKNIVLIRSSKTKNKIFMIHDGTGNITGYNRLSKYLSKRFNCYGIRAENFFAPEKNKRTEINKIAKKYMQQIRAVQSAGPYNILGWSVGGVIAFEVCRLIKLKYKDLVNLILIDVPHPDLFSKRSKNIEIEGLRNYKDININKEKYFKILSSHFENNIKSDYSDLIYKILINFGEYIYGISEIVSYKLLDILMRNMFVFGNSLKNYEIKNTVCENVLIINAERSMFKSTLDQNDFNHSRINKLYLNDDHFTIINNKQLPQIVDKFFSRE